jgi:tRNA pseudouridine55 synthase
MECSKGCYVRSIARDIAMKLGSYSNVTELRRIKIGNFEVQDASERIIPTIEIFNNYEKVYIDDETSQNLMNGIRSNINTNNLGRFLLINTRYNLLIIAQNTNGELKLKRIS